MRHEPIRFFEQTITVLAAANDSRGAVGVVEVSGPAGSVPPLHVHRHEDEAFYVVEGAYRVFIGDDVTVATPGTWVWGPRGVPHGYQVDSPRGRHLSLVMPGGFEAFFDEVAAFTSPGTDPRAERSRLASVAQRYGVELLGPAPRPQHAHTDEQEEPT